MLYEVFKPHWRELDLGIPSKLKQSRFPYLICFEIYVYSPRLVDIRKVFVVYLYARVQLPIVITQPSTYLEAVLHLGKSLTFSNR